MEYGEGARCLIKDATMKFTYPREFNDLFDCLPSYSLDSVEQLIKNNKDVFKKAGRGLGYPPAKRIMNKGKIIENIKKSVNQGDWTDSIRKNVGICSLTTKACNLLMWAHYGDNHRGIVAEFKNEIPEDSELTEEYLCSFIVKYEKDKPVRELMDGDYVHDLLIKGNDWNYENEIRCIDMNRKSGIHKYRRNLLESIILGVKFDDNKFSEIKSLIDNVNRQYSLNIKLYQAKIVQGSFKIHIPGHPVYDDPSWE